MEKSPIKVTWVKMIWPNTIKWMESMRNEWIEVNRGEMSDLMDLTWMNPMARSLWSRESVPIKMTWFFCCDQILSKWSESMRNEWIEWNEVKWVIWWIWLCEPYESDLSESNEKVPMSWEWVSLSIWLDWSQWESPYQNDQIWLNRGRISE